MMAQKQNFLTNPTITIPEIPSTDLFSNSHLLSQLSMQLLLQLQLFNFLQLQPSQKPNLAYNYPI